MTSNDPVYLAATPATTALAGIAVGGLSSFFAGLWTASRRRFPSLRLERDRIVLQLALFSRRTLQNAEVEALTLKPARMHGREQIGLEIRTVDGERFMICESMRGFFAAARELHVRTGRPIDQEGDIASEIDPRAAEDGSAERRLQGRSLAYELGVLFSLSAALTAALIAIQAILVFELFSNAQGTPRPDAIYAIPISLALAGLVMRLIVFPLVRRSAMHRKVKGAGVSVGAGF